jgi:hypothetical protein
MRLNSRLIAPLVAAIAATTWLGCGVKSQPIPPQYAKPERIADLKGANLTDGIRLTWHRPARYAGGAAMRDLGSFTIVRTEAGGPMKQIARIPVTDQGRFQVQQIFTYQDPAPTAGKTYRYRVMSETTDGYVSDPSNEVSILRKVPPPPPNPETFALPTPTPLP